MDNFDLIFGMHSVAEALKNKNRENLELFCTDDSLSDLKKLHFAANSLPKNIEIHMMSPHALQEEAKMLSRELEFKESRAPSHIFLKAQSWGRVDIQDFYRTLEEKESIKILALDQVTDVHNLAAIIRTAAFYNIDTVAFSKKGQKTFPPSFFRIASGGVEHVQLLNCSSMSKFIHKMQEKGVLCVGLSEHATTEVISKDAKTCFVMGSEETGLSNATKRVLNDFVSLQPHGKIKSLNVSVAAAVAIEKFWTL